MTRPRKMREQLEADCARIQRLEGEVETLHASYAKAAKERDEARRELRMQKAINQDLEIMVKNMSEHIERSEKGQER